MFVPRLGSLCRCCSGKTPMIAQSWSPESVGSASLIFWELEGQKFKQPGTLHSTRPADSRGILSSYLAARLTQHIPFISGATLKAARQVHQTDGLQNTLLPTLLQGQPESQWRLPQLREKAPLHSITVYSHTSVYIHVFTKHVWYAENMLCALCLPEPSESATAAQHGVECDKCHPSGTNTEWELDYNYCIWIHRSRSYIQSLQRHTKFLPASRISTSLSRAF